VLHLSPRHVRNFGVRVGRGRYSLWESVSAYAASLRAREPKTEDEIYAQLIAELNALE
jgi:hypothetical protein